MTFLLPAGYIDETVLIHIAYISGIEPSVPIYCGGGSFCILVISQHDRLSSDEYLAFSVFIWILDLYFITYHGFFLRNPPLYHNPVSELR